MNAINSIQTLGTAGRGGPVQSIGQTQAAVRFSDVLQDKVNELKFSAHAQTRIRSRNIELTSGMMEKLQNAVSTAKAKGASNSLILFPDAAFIVNIPNRTVVTAMDGENIRDNIFTNIDSTVIAGR
jgi:flagellar operon protein